MKLFQINFEKTGYTLQQRLLGQSTFATIEPVNIDSMLSEKFVGKQPSRVWPSYHD